MAVFFLPLCEPGDFLLQPLYSSLELLSFFDARLHRHLGPKWRHSKVVFQVTPCPHFPPYRLFPHVPLCLPFRELAPLTVGFQLLPDPLLGLLPCQLSKLFQHPFQLLLLLPLPHTLTPSYTRTSAAALWHRMYHPHSLANHAVQQQPDSPHCHHQPV